MAEQDAVYPGYGFASNAGYGVVKHRAAIERLGVTPLHRLSFAPLAKYADNKAKPRAVPQKTVVQSGEPPVGYPQKIIRGPRKVAQIFSENITPDAGNVARIDLSNTISSETKKPMTTRQIGDKGEQAAADWLTADDHEIMAQN